MVRVDLCLLRYELDVFALEGHTGHILGYNAATLRDPETDALITVTANTDHATVGLTAVKIAEYLRSR